MENKAIINLRNEYLKLEELETPFDLDESVSNMLRYLMELNADELYSQSTTEAILGISATLEREVVDCIDEYRTGKEIRKRSNYKLLMQHAVKLIRKDVKPVLDAM
ncbi:MAG TPA: hypothetical protein VLB84_03095 [Bacteroidia bacterium]|nr:hypothetical protein [Bacteroidia bacterium]